MAGKNVSDDSAWPKYMTAEHGWRIFPVAGKAPLVKSWPQDATTNADQIDAWARMPKRTGWAWAIGPGWVVIDLDGDTGKRAWADLVAEHGPIETWATETGGGGMHYIFRLPDGMTVRNSIGRVAPGIDVKTAGGYIVIPPSKHQSGKQYRWHGAARPGEVDVAEAPRWLVELLIRTAGRAAAEPAGESAAPIPAGQRNAKLASLAGTMRRRGLDREAIEAALLAHNAKYCQPPLPDAEVRVIATSISRYAPADAVVAAREYAKQHAAPRGRPATTKKGDDKTYQPQEYKILSVTAYMGDDVSYDIEVEYQGLRAVVRVDDFESYINPRSIMAIFARHFCTVPQELWDVKRAAFGKYMTGLLASARKVYQEDDTLAVASVNFEVERQLACIERYVPGDTVTREELALQPRFICGDKDCIVFSAFFRQVLQASIGGIMRKDVRDALKRLGYQSESIYVGGVQIRVWSKKLEREEVDSETREKADGGCWPAGHGEDDNVIADSGERAVARGSGGSDTAAFVFPCGGQGGQGEGGGGWHEGCDGEDDTF